MRGGGRGRGPLIGGPFCGCLHPGRPLAQRPHILGALLLLQDLKEQEVGILRSDFGDTLNVEGHDQSPTSPGL